MESLTLQIDDQWLAVDDLEEDFQIVKLYLFGIVVDSHVHLLTWG